MRQEKVVVVAASYARRASAEGVMRHLFGFMWVVGFAIMPLVGCGEGETAGSAGSGGPAHALVAGPPVTVSGTSLLAGCDAAAPQGWADAETEPFIAINPTNPNNLVGIWMQDKSPRRALVAGVTFDGGRVWESVVIPGLSLCSGGDLPGVVDPWLAFATNGDLYAASGVFEDRAGKPGVDGILVSKSSDGGRTWGPPTTITRDNAPLQRIVNDKESITIDPADQCSIYVTWTQFNKVLQGDVVFSRTTDCGRTWTEPQIVYEGAVPGLGAQVVVLPDGTLLDFAQAAFGDAVPIYVKRSSDRGETWPGLPTVVATVPDKGVVTPDGEKIVRTGPFAVAVNHKTGHLSVVWQQAFGDAPPVHIAYSSSSDGGLTWSTPIRIDRTPPNASFDREQAFLPSVAVSDDGTIGVSYYNFQNDIPDDSRADTDRWFIYCDPDLADCDNEAGWSDGFRLTLRSFDYLTAPTATAVSAERGLFLGDYAGLTAAGSDFFAFFPVTSGADPGNTIFVPIRAR